MFDFISYVVVEHFPDAWQVLRFHPICKGALAILWYPFQSTLSWLNTKTSHLVCNSINGLGHTFCPSATYLWSEQSRNFHDSRTDLFKLKLKMPKLSTASRITQPDSGILIRVIVTTTIMFDCYSGTARPQQTYKLLTIVANGLNCLKLMKVPTQTLKLTKIWTDSVLLTVVLEKYEFGRPVWLL